MRRLFLALMALSLGSAAAAQTTPAPSRGPQPTPPAHVDAPPRTFVGPASAAAAPAAPVAVADPENTLVLDLSTGGRVLIAMRPDKAPKHVERVKTLARQHFYDGLIFHRVIDGFMAQGGDPTGTGQGGSKLPDLKAEFNELPHMRGTAAMARSESEDSANSQFYIMLAPRFVLDNKYTVWGRVISGMEWVDAINKGEPPANPSKIVRASVAADNVPPPSAAEIAAAAAPPPPPIAPITVPPPAEPKAATTTTTKTSVAKPAPKAAAKPR